MKPEIYEVTKSGKRHAWLVDSDTAFLRPCDGVSCKHYGAAVEIGDLEPGALKFTNDPVRGERVIFGPRCCLLVVKVHKPGAKPRTLSYPESRGFDRRAAAILLELAAACNDLRPSYGVRPWDFFGPAEKGFAHPWDALKFLAAWRFSAWESGTLAGLNRKLTGPERYADMAALGYPHAPGTLRQMLKRMGLVRPKPGKDTGPTWSL